jgi:hypothetical protein
MPSDEPLFIRQIREAAGKDQTEKPIDQHLLLLWQRLNQVEEQNLKLAQDVTDLMGRTGVLNHDMHILSTGLEQLCRNVISVNATLNHLSAANETITETFPEFVARKLRAIWKRD